LGDRARVEIARAEMSRLEDAAIRESVVASVRDAGYAEVTIDPEGYRRGRLNEALRVVQITA
jgi:uncharacterized protein